MIAAPAVQPATAAPSGVEGAGRPIRILRMSRSVCERLRAAPEESGWVHSSYARTLNLLWHDGRLLTLHGPGLLLAPFAAALSRLPTGLRPGMRVTREGDQIRVGSCPLRWEGGAEAEVRIRPAAGDAAAVLTALVDRGTCGAAPGLLSPMGHLGQRQIGRGIRGRDTRAFLAGTAALIGLGEGLTPAGDDCLVGALAVLSRFAPAWLAEQPVIRTAITAASEAGTTTVAREFLLHALDGSFSEPVVHLMHARSAAEALEYATRLAGMGGSSGADTLRGISLALEALQP